MQSGIWLSFPPLTGVHARVCVVCVSINWELGEGVDSARGVTAIVVCCRNSSCNSSRDAIAHNGRRTLAFFLLFRKQSFVCNRLCEGMFRTCFECGRRGQVLQSHPLPISPLLQTPQIKYLLQIFSSEPLLRTILL